MPPMKMQIMLAYNNSIDAANNQKDRLTAEYANLTTADAKNQNIDAQLQQQAAITSVTDMSVSRICADIMKTTLSKSLIFLHYPIS